MEPTPEQQDLVSRINECKDYYDVLGVEMDASEDDVIAASKQRAEALNPDQNQAPGARQAFNAVGYATRVLSCLEKRREYDLMRARRELVALTHEQVYLKLCPPPVSKADCVAASSDPLAAAFPWLLGASFLVGLGVGAAGVLAGAAAYNYNACTATPAHPVENEEEKR